MNIKVEKMTLWDKKMFYIQNMHPMMDRGALFSDETAGFRVPEEPEKNSDVRIKFRTAKNNADGVYLCMDNEEKKMNLVLSTELFD